MDIRLDFSDAQIQKLKKEFKWIPGASQRAAVAAINKTLPGMRTDAVREVTKVYIIKASDVRATIPDSSIKKAAPGRIEGIIRSDGPAIELIKFKVNPRNVTKPRPKLGVKAQVRKDRGGGAIPRSFIIDGSRIKHGVYRRKDKRRFALLRQFGPAVPSMLKDIGAYQRIQASADKRLEKNLDHEIYRILKGYGK